MRYILLIFLITSIIHSQSVRIEGIVKDRNSNFPLAGVNISVENSSIGSTTDNGGRYAITQLSSGHYSLTFSYIGYAQKRITFSLSQDTTINISLTQTILDGPIVSTVATVADPRRSAVTYSEIEKEDLVKRYNTQDIPELIADLPSTTFYSEGGSGIGYNYLSIRGFGQRRISVLINGIPQNDPEDHNLYWVDIPDLASNTETIQVQRGAGNAFYGPAAIGGSINIQTNPFSPERKITASYGSGSFNTRKAMFSVNSGLIGDEYIFYGRVSNTKTDGYRDRSWVDFWSYFLGAARYTNESSLRIHFYGAPIEDGLVYNGLPKFFNTDASLRRKNWSYFGLNSNADSVEYFGERRRDEVEKFNQPHLEILHQIQINPQMTLDNCLFYTRGYGYFDYDGSWATPEYFRLTPEFGFAVDEIPANALIRAYVDNKQFGWLPQLSIKSNDDQMILGGELRVHRSLHWGRIQKADGLPEAVVGSGARRYYEYHGGKDVASVYFHHNHQWFQNVILQTDLQYTFKQYHLFDEQFIGTEFTVPYNFVNPRIGLRYDITPESNGYFSIYSTKREPRLKNLYDAAEASTPASWGAVIPQFELNDDGSYNFDKPLVKPETLTGIELGYGYNDNTFGGTINFYYMDFRDEIVKAGGIDRFGQPITGNAERSRHYGTELEGRYLLTQALSLSGNASISRNELVSYREYSSDGTFVKLDGNPIAGFPDLLGNIRITYHWQNIFASLSARYIGEAYTDNYKNEKNKRDTFTLINMEAQYSLNDLGAPFASLQFRINNLLNTKYMSHGEGQEFFPGATRNFYTALKITL
ncbi:MAG: TonB-dependent receptor [Calditrichaeota bacterium]|nr:TonB-dependent receptor [Calditrichota bacterium]